MKTIMSCKKYLFLLIPFLLFVVACDRVVEDPKGDEMARLQAWLQVHNITTTPTASGLYYMNKQEGTGISPVDTNFVLFSYVERDLSENVFATSYRDTAKLYDLYKPTTHYTPEYQQIFSNVSQLKGLVEGLEMMREGGKARLIMPSELGYGKNGSGSISGNTTILYDIELNKVVPDPAVYEQSLIDEYLAKNPGFTLISDSIYMKQLDDGARNSVVAKDSNVYVYYTGRFLDGYVFDTNVLSVAYANNIYSSSKSYSLLNFVIGGGTVKPGFDLAVRHMIEGEKVRVIIPSAYVYGKEGNSSGSPIIQPYSTLVFDIELKYVKAKS
jgi:FKBP-type peptidyl-prolyl cis-trans isomerase